jgi:TonB family protein
MARRLATALLLICCFASFVAAQAIPRGVRVSEEVMESFLTKKAPPEYPSLARQAHIQGTVTLQVWLSKSGDVENVQLVSGHPLLATAAIDAVKQWKYRPYLLNGQPVEVQTRVRANFTLADKPPASGIAGDIPGGALPEHTGGIADSSLLPGRVRVSSGVESGLLLKKVPPVYPQDAKDAHIQGAVVMKTVIDKEGNVAHIELYSGHPMLAPAALDAVRQWKYRPYLLNRQPVEVETEVQVNFTLVP